MSISFCRALTCLVGVVFVASIANAQNIKAKELPLLPEIVVIATTPLPTGGLQRESIPAPLQTADANAIERTHSTDLGEFMNRQLGSVYINDVQNNPLQPDLNYRGYTASPLLGTPQGLAVYMDGVRLNQPFGDVISWDLIPLAAIANITLMPGSNPLFGLNALGGALSIHTKDGYSHPGMSVQTYYGSNARRLIEFDHGGNNGNGLNWFVTGNLFRERGWRDDSPSSLNQLFGKLGWRGDQSDVALTAAYAKSDLTGNGMQEQRLLANDYASAYTKPDITNNRSVLLNLGITHKISSPVSFSGNAFYRSITTSSLNGDSNESSLDQSLYQPTAAEQTALTAAGYSGFPASGESAINTPFPSWRCIANVLLNEAPNEECNGLMNRTHTDQQIAGLSGQLSIHNQTVNHDNRFTVGFTLDVSQVDFKQSTQFGYLNPDRSIAPVTGLGAFADGTQNSQNAFDARVDLVGHTRTWSVYATDTFSVRDIWHLTVSGRYNHATTVSRDQITPSGQTGSLDGDNTFSRFNPAIGLTVTPTADSNAYLSYSESNRSPSAIELGCADANNSCKLPNAMAGDPPLKQVVATTWELGVRSTASARFNWNAGVFRADNRDDILFVAATQSGFGYFANFGKTRRQGIELGFSKQIGAINLGANYTYLDATYRSAETINGAANSTNDTASTGNIGFDGNIEVLPGNKIPLIPQHTAKFFGEYAINSKISMSMDMLAVSGTYARGNENNQHQPDDVYYLGVGKTPGYAVFNLGVDYRPDTKWKFFAQINNLFDRRYYTAAQLGVTSFRSDGTFVARPFAAPVINGERPLVHATFYSPGAPRSISIGVQYQLGARKK